MNNQGCIQNNVNIMLLARHCISQHLFMKSYLKVCGTFNLLGINVQTELTWWNWYHLLNIEIRRSNLQSDVQSHHSSPDRVLHSLTSSPSTSDKGVGSRLANCLNNASLCRWKSTTSLLNCQSQTFRAMIFYIHCLTAFWGSITPKRL